MESMMTWLLLATGFTGALTFSFLLRVLGRSLGAPSVTAHFSPKKGCTDAVVGHLGGAKKEVLILAGAFSSEPLAKAVLDAKMRGVRVEILLDKGAEKDPSSDLHHFADQGLVPLLDSRPAGSNDHNVILIDGRLLITGSFGFTRQSEEERASSLLVIGGHPEVIEAHRVIFHELRSSAREYKPATPGKKDTPIDKALPEAPRKAA
jgi:phosphatidylserine/phosphatidylglycerophosphate/cardiolipin synthase-like enzyme